MKSLLSLLAMNIIFVTFGCQGCGSGMAVTNIKTTKENNEEGSNSSNRNLVANSNQDKAEDKVNSDTKNIKESKHFKLTRTAFGKQVNFEIDRKHIGGEAYTVTYEESVGDENFERSNRIIQLSPTVLLYRRFPKEVEKDFYHIDQPETIEFFDIMYNTVKVVDIWKNHPYKSYGKKLTYYNFDAEGMEVIPYKDQDKKEIANEFSMFTEVISEGNHVIVNYQLRLLNSNYQMIGVKHTLKIYDLSGNLKYELKDLPSVDGAVVSNNGQYVMYTFGGRGLRTANDPFGTIDREGWALMRLKDHKVVYQEFTDDGVLAFNRLWLEGNFLRVAYSTPKVDDGLDHFHVFIDIENMVIFKKLWSNNEWNNLTKEWKTTENKKWEFYLKKYSFQKIPIIQE